MSERKLRPIDWKKTDSENFSELLAQGFAERSMEYLPGGLVLKKPIPVEDKYGSSEIQVIGIPFKNVFGQTKFRYHRIKLSEFEAIYKQILGDELSPIRMDISGDDDDAVLEKTKDNLSKRLAILPQRFVLELVEKKMKAPEKPQYKYKFYFSIPETDFTDKNNGLSIINDKDVFIYVENPNIKIENGHGSIEIDDALVVLRDSSDSMFVNGLHGSTVNTLPHEYKFIDISVLEDFGNNPVNRILYRSPGGILKAKTSQTLREHLLRISATRDLKYENGTVEVGFNDSEHITLKITTHFDTEYEVPLEDQIPKYNGPTPIDQLITLTSQSAASVNTSFTIQEVKRSKQVCQDELIAISSQSPDSINPSIVSIDYKQTRQISEEQLIVLSIQSSSSISVTITSSGQ